MKSAQMMALGSSQDQPDVCDCFENMLIVKHFYFGIAEPSKIFCAQNQKETRLDGKSQRET